MSTGTEELLLQEDPWPDLLPVQGGQGQPGVHQYDSSPGTGFILESLSIQYTRCTVYLVNSFLC